MVLIGPVLDELAWLKCLLEPALAKAPELAVAPERAFQGQGDASGLPPPGCEECGGAFPLSKPPEWVKDMSQRWLCAGCCLREDADANPFQFMKGNLEQVWLSQAHLFSLQGAATPRGSRPRGLPPGRRAVVVIWDPTSADCQVVGAALLHGFGELCRFVDVRSPADVEEVLRPHPGILREDVCRRGTMAAIFPHGCWTSACERRPKVLLYELKYLRSVRMPPVSYCLALDRDYLQPLQGIRNELGSRVRWWLEPRALALISESLERQQFVLIDGFLPEAEWRQMAEEAKRLNRNGHYEPGRKKGTSHLTEDDADLMNRDDRPLKWTMLDDNIAYCGDRDGRMPSVGRFHMPAMDTLVSALKGGASVCASTSSRLARVDLREKAMVTVYRESTRGRYQQHVDSHDAKYRRLSTLLYMNEDWQPEDGGENRMFTEGALSTQAKHDTAPLANRAILFWAGDECPHEVMPTWRDRYACTVWYADADVLVRDMLGEPAGMAERVASDHMKVVGHLQTAFPVAPLDFQDTMLRAGVPSEEARRLHAVHSFLAYDVRPPHWMAQDDAKSALQGNDPRIRDYLPAAAVI